MASPENRHCATCIGACTATRLMRRHRFFSESSHPSCDRPTGPHHAWESIGACQYYLSGARINCPRATRQWRPSNLPILDPPQGQSSTSCSACRRRRQATPRNKPWAPEWRIVYIYEQEWLECKSISFLTL